MQEILGNDDVSESTSSQILFPASHGLGFTATLLLHYLVDQHNSIIRAFAEDSNIQLTTVTCQEIDSSILVAVDAQDLHLALVANSECNFGLEESEAANTKWTINEHGLEQHVVNRYPVCFDV